MSLRHLPYKSRYLARVSGDAFLLKFNEYENTSMVVYRIACLRMCCTLHNPGAHRDNSHMWCYHLVMLLGVRQIL